MPSRRSFEGRGPHPDSGEGGQAGRTKPAGYILNISRDIAPGPQAGESPTLRLLKPKMPPQTKRAL